MVGALGLALACGPSLRMIHESDTYYERCYAADVDPQITVDTRRECWALWLEHYTPGQPPDRVAHARSRLAALEAGEVAPPLPGSPLPPVTETTEASDAGVEATAVLDGATPEPLPEGAVAAGTDAGPVGPPRPDSPEVRAAYRPPPPVTVTTACDPVCQVGWDECIPRCDDRTRACHSACQAQYRRCQAACY
jgi:hypothetical protein